MTPFLAFVAVVLVAGFVLSRSASGDVAGRRFLLYTPCWPRVIGGSLGVAAPAFVLLLAANLFFGRAPLVALAGSLVIVVGAAIVGHHVVWIHRRLGAMLVVAWLLTFSALAVGAK